jgi:hypothetical protein
MSDTAVAGVVLINVFTADRAPGFISAALHRSLDGPKGTMYAQWQSKRYYQAMRKDPGLLPFLEEALTLATFEPGMYEIVKRFGPIGPSV